MRKNDRVKTNPRNGAAAKGSEAANLGGIRERETAIADHGRVAQSQTAIGAKKDIGTRQSSSMRSSGPLKVGETDGEFESGPSFSAAVKQTFGTSDGHLSAALLLQVTRALPQADSLDPHGDHALAALYGIGPRNTLEGFLSVQMVAGHNLAMEFLRRAARKEQPPQGVEIHVNLATKLLRTFIAQLEALDRHRGEGEQELNVGNVHIHEGPQGIVGPVSQQGSLDASEGGHGKSN